MKPSLNFAKSIARTLFVVLTLSVAVGLLLKSTSSRDAEARGQETERVVEKNPLKNEPLEIEEVKLKTKTVDLGRPFLSGNDWLQGITFKLKNVSRRVLLRAELELEFPEIKLDNATFLLTIHDGQIPDLPDSDSVEMPPVQPDQTFELRLDDSTYAALSQQVFARQPLITKARVLISTAYFADGTAWHHGFWHRRDPKNPRKWIIIDQPSEQKGIQDPSKTGFLRHHAAHKYQPPLRVVPAQQQCDVTYYGFENVNCGTVGSEENCSGTSRLLWTNKPGRIHKRCTSSKCDRQSKPIQHQLL